MKIKQCLKCLDKTERMHNVLICFYVQVILAGFAEQSKTSVVHMCSLFHAFILCQLWTVYLEQTISMAPPRDDAIILAGSILLDFWGKVTPGLALKYNFCSRFEY